MNEQPEQLQALLEDTQESLAAALARIEGFRIREKHLLQEIVQLQQKLHEHEKSGAKPAAAQHVEDNAAEPSSQEEAVPANELVRVKSVSTYGQFWSAIQSGPVYITPVDDECIVTIFQNSKSKDAGTQYLRHPTDEQDRHNKKGQANLILGRDFIEVVEVKARIRAEDFIGITSAPPELVKCKRQSSSEDLTKEPLWRSKFLPELTIGGGDYDEPEPEAEHEPGEVGSEKGYWQILWRQAEQPPNRLVFEASQATRESLHKHTERWIGEEVPDHDDSVQPAAAPDEENEVELSMPHHLVGGSAPMPGLSEPSTIMSEQHVSALANVIPSRFRFKEWSLSYSTARHGISLSTLYRRMMPHSPAITVIKDSSGYVFGCYTPEPWRVASRFYGSGETFVFQLEPHRVMYPWKLHTTVKNDYFMYGALDYIAVGGQGHFAIYMDGELLQGSSGKCGTFGSPCLSHKEEFKVMAVEVWQVVL